MDSNLDDDLTAQLKAFYGQAELSSARMATLLAMAEAKTDGETNVPASSTRPRRWPYAVAAAALLCLAAIGWGLQQPSVAEEIAANHLKAHAPTIQTADFDALGPALPRLDFVPIASERLANYRLVGARYCSVAGHLAAQLQLRDARGRRFTLYQADSAATPDAASLGQFNVDGVRVDAWHEAGLLMGLAGPAGTPPTGVRP